LKTRKFGLEMALDLIYLGEGKFIKEETGVRFFESLPFGRNSEESAEGHRKLVLG
jgi:predicted membrane protein